MSFEGYQVFDMKNIHEWGYQKLFSEQNEPREVYQFRFFIQIESD